MGVSPKVAAIIFGAPPIVAVIIFGAPPQMWEYLRKLRSSLSEDLRRYGHKFRSLFDNFGRLSENENDEAAPRGIVFTVYMHTGCFLNFLNP